MRQDLQLSLRRSGIDPLTLKDFQRILLTTDGTVTDVLEAYYREPMQVKVLSQSQMAASQAIPALAIDAGHEILARDILLQGKISGSFTLAATSSIVLDRLSEPIRDGLLSKQKPIGHLILEHRVETFKQITACGREPARALSQYFQIHEDAPLLHRTYTVFARARPIMQITEKFPEWGR